MIYCKYCQGSGCLYCPEPEPPPLPEPIARFNLNDPDDVELAKQTIGGPAIEKAFAPGGGGFDEILENCQKSRIIQALRQTKQSEVNESKES